MQGLTKLPINTYGF